MLLFFVAYLQLYKKVKIYLKLRYKCGKMEDRVNRHTYSPISSFKSQLALYQGVEPIPSHVFEIVERCVEGRKDEPVTRRLIYQILLDQGLSKYLLDTDAIFVKVLKNK